MFDKLLSDGPMLEKIVELVNGKYSWTVKVLLPFIILALPILHLYSTIKGKIQGPYSESNEEQKE